MPYNALRGIDATLCSLDAARLEGLHIARDAGVGSRATVSLNAKRPDTRNSREEGKIIVYVLPSNALYAIKRLVAAI